MLDQRDDSWPQYSVAAVADETEELTDAERRNLLIQIARAGKLAVPTFNSAEATVGPVYRRVWYNFWVRKLHFWRLEGLSQPLWLASDGVIYRAYDEWGRSNAKLLKSGIAKPHYWMRAQIQYRTRTGLERILNILAPDPEA